MGKIEVQSFKKSTYFWTFSDNFVQNIVKFSQKIFAIFGLKSSKLRRFFGIWKWTEDEDEDGSSDKNLRSFEDLRSFVATLVWRSKISWLFLIHYELSENQKKIFWFFTVFWGDLEGAGWFSPSPHSQATSRSPALLGLKMIFRPCYLIFFPY